MDKTFASLLIKNFILHMNGYMYMTFDKVNFGRQNCESMAVRISRSYKIM